MADISGIGGGINPNIPAINRNPNDDTPSLQERIREEARNAAREVLNERAGPASPEQANLSPNAVETLQRSSPRVIEDDPRERAIEERTSGSRGFRPEDTTDQVNLSERAQNIIAERQQVQREEENSDTQATAREAQNNFVAQGEERFNVNNRVATEDINNNLARQTEANEFGAAQSQNSEEERSTSQRDQAQREENRGVEQRQEQLNVNAEQVAAVNIYQQTQNLAIANDNQTNATQVANNAQDTSNTNGNLDQTNIPVGQRVLGQIIDQFA